MLNKVKNDERISNLSVCTFIVLNAFNKDATALRKDPVTSLIAVLSNHHGAQRGRRVKHPLSDSILLLKRQKVQSDELQC